MRSDLVNELLIFQKWRDSRAPIKFKLASPAISLQGWASVARADDSEVALDLKDGAGFMVLDPSQCSLRYQDPREADAPVSADVESKAVCALSVSAPGEIDLFLYEWRDDAS